MYLIIRCTGSAYVQSVYDIDKLVGIYGNQDVINLFESGNEFMSSNADIHDNTSCII